MQNVENVTDFRITKLGEDDYTSPRDKHLLSPGRQTPLDSRLDSVSSALKNYYSKKHLVNDDTFLTEMDITI